MSDESGTVVVKAPPWSAQACDDWIERFGGTAPGGRIGAALKPLVGRLGWEAVRAAWRNYLAQAEARFANAQQFANTFGEWTAAPGVGNGSALARIPSPGSGPRSKAELLDRKVARLLGGGS